MSMSPSQLRQDLYRVLDEVLATGIPVVIQRKGRTLRIVADEPASRLCRLVSRPEVVSGDPEDLVHLDWSAEWRP